MAWGVRAGVFLLFLVDKKLIFNHWFGGEQDFKSGVNGKFCVKTFYERTQDNGFSYSSVITFRNYIL